MYVKRPPTPSQQRAILVRKQRQALVRGNRQIQKAAKDNARAVNKLFKQRRRSAPQPKPIRFTRAETGAVLAVFGWLVTKRLFWIFVAVMIIIGLMR